MPEEYPDPGEIRESSLSAYQRWRRSQIAQGLLGPTDIELEAMGGKPGSRAGLMNIGGAFLDATTPGQVPIIKEAIEGATDPIYNPQNAAMAFARKAALGVAGGPLGQALMASPAGDMVADAAGQSASGLRDIAVESPLALEALGGGLAKGLRGARNFLRRKMANFPYRFEAPAELVGKRIRTFTHAPENEIPKTGGFSPVEQGKPPIQIPEGQAQAGVAFRGGQGEGQAARNLSLDDYNGLLEQGTGKSSTEKAHSIGMQANSIAALENLAELRMSMASKMREAGKAGDMNQMAYWGSRAQYPRESIEAAINAGSAAESGINKLGARPLDWRTNPGVAEWLRDNGKRLGIHVPNMEDVIEQSGAEFLAARPRGTGGQEAEALARMYPEKQKWLDAYNQAQAQLTALKANPGPENFNDIMGLTFKKQFFNEGLRELGAVP